TGHRLVPYLCGVVGHLKLGPPESLYHRVEGTGRENPVLRQHAKITRAGVLRQISHSSGAGDRPGGRQRLSGQDPGQRGLSGTVAPDQSDLASAPDLEGGGLEEQPGARTDLEFACDQHQTLKPRARSWSRPSSVIISKPHGGIQTQLIRKSETRPSRAVCV